MKYYSMKYHGITCICAYARVRIHEILLHVYARAYELTSNTLMFLDALKSRGLTGGKKIAECRVRLNASTRTRTHIHVISLLPVDENFFSNFMCPEAFELIPNHVNTQLQYDR